MKKLILIGLAIIASSQALLAQAAEANPASLTRVSLDGAWQVSDADKNDWLAATVPGCVHTDLLKAGKIPDPFYRDNEGKVQWVGETDWKYKRTFQVSGELLQRDRVLLRCEGLDTLAKIKINGKEVGRADNMFRTWEYNVKSALQAGANEIEITFASPFPYMKSRKSTKVGKMKDSAFVRKEPCQFGWDWGPTLVTCGIYKKIALVAFDTARLSDVLILQDHSQKGRVDLQVQVAAETTRASALRAVVSVRDNEKEVGTAEMALADGKGSGSVTINEPKLWWPNGMGDHPLYTVETRLLDANGNLLDQSSKRIGLRTLKLLPPDKATRTPLRFEVNGVQYFSKGANCIPFDSFNTRVTPEILRRYIADAAAANMNTLRFWGGGYYEEDEAFDACDEMGIVVWLDFKFACSGYPTFDNAFMENVKLEARDQLLRLRDHPSIGVWCGNNEIAKFKYMSKDEYDKLFHELLGGQAKTYAPQANYVPGSPDCGDNHYWGVWHQRKPIEDYQKQSGFMSEFGMQSFPEPKTVDLFTTEDDRKLIDSPVMKAHEKNRKGIETIVNYINDNFKPAKDFNSTLWLSQIMQALAIKIGAEAWRQQMPKSMGCIFWQYNDCWPVASWASVDYYGRWKALQYAARRFYAPLLVSGLEHPDKGTVDVFVTSDRMETSHGKVSWMATDVNGKVLEQGSKELEIPAHKSQQVCTVDLAKQCQALGAKNILTWLKLEVGGKTVSENLVFLTPPKELELLNPEIQCDVAPCKEGFVVTLTAQKPALWAWLTLSDGDAKYSDNFVHLFPGSPKQIVVSPARTMALEEFKQSLHVLSLFNTYTP